MKSRATQPARGQALVLFTLFVVVILVLAGFAIDGLRAGILRSQAQRAAEAAARAGAIYLPDYPDATASAPDGYNAESRALAEAARNGFTNPADITITALPGPPMRLHVVIHYQVALTLTAVFAATPRFSKAAATAMAFKPIALFGGTNPAVLSSAAGGVHPVLVGPNGPKALGDPYSVWCVTPTQCSPGTPGNPDQVPTGYNGLGTRIPFGLVPSGASYRVTLPPGGQSYGVWVRGAAATDDLGQLAISLFQVPMIYRRATDIPVAAIWPFAPPPNTLPAPPLLASQILAATALPTPSTSWVRLPATLVAPLTMAATYRLVAEAINGSSPTGYAVRVCLDTAGAPDCAPPGVHLSAWNFATLAITAAGTYPFVVLPAAYAGRQVAFRLYGAALGGATVAITAPGDTTPTMQFTIPVAPGDQWFPFTLTLPPDYAGGAWQVTFTLATTPAIFTLTADLVGPPVELLVG